MKVQNTGQRPGMESKLGTVLQYARRAAFSAPVKLLFAVAATGQPNRKMLNQSLRCGRGINRRNVKDDPFAGSLLGPALLVLESSVKNLIKSLCPAYLAALLLPALAAWPAPAQDLDPRRVGSWPGFDRGGAQKVAVEGSHAYVAAGALQVIDIHDPDHPRLARGYSNLRGVRDVAVSGSHAFVLDGDGALYVIDIVDLTAKPVRVDGYGVNGYEEDVGWIAGVAVLGQHLFLTSPDFGLHILDISDPLVPRRVGTYAVPSLSPPVVSDGHVYLIEGRWNPPFDRRRLHVIDISEPANPRQVGAYDTSGPALSLAVSGQYACLALGDLGLEVIDLSDPGHPRRVATYAAEANAVAMTRQYVFLVTGGSLQVLDISDPANPKRTGTIEIIGAVSHLLAADQSLYVATWDHGLQIFDISDHNQPRPTGAYFTGGDVQDVAVSGNYAYLADDVAGLQVIDIGDLANPKRAGGINTGGRSTRVAISGNLACMDKNRWDQGGDWWGVELVDISDPAQPKALSAIETGGIATGVAASGSLVCVAHPGGENTALLEIVDVSDPFKPKKSGEYKTLNHRGNPNAVSEPDVAISGHHAYLVSTSFPNEGSDLAIGKLDVIDISDPANPRRVGGYEARGRALGVAVADGYAFLAGIRTENFGGDAVPDVLQSLTIIDVRDPVNPRRVGGSDTRYGARAVAVSGSHAYVTDSWRGIQVFDISDPAAPTRIWRHTIGGACNGLAILGQNVLVASASFSNPWFGARGEGLVVIDPNQMAHPQRLGRLGSQQSPGFVAVAGRHAYVSQEGLKVIDLTDPGHPRQIADYPINHPVVDLAVAAPYAYLLESWWDNEKIQGRGRFSMIDISDPARPLALGAHETLREAIGMAVSGTHACVAERWSAEGGVRSRLSVIDVSNPAVLQPLGAIESTEAFSDVAMAGAYAYLVIGSSFNFFSGLQVVDLSDPAQPRSVGRFRTTGNAIRIGISGHVACVLEGRGERFALVVFDLRDPDQPRRMGEVDWIQPLRFWFDPPLSVTVSGGYAYVASGWQGSHVIDISDPTNPRRVGGNGSFSAYHVAVDEDTFVLTGEEGLMVFHPLRQLRFGRVAVGRDRRLHLPISGLPGQQSRVQRSLNLTDWEDWRMIMLENGESDLLTDEVDAPRRFYRVIQP